MSFELIKCEKFLSHANGIVTQVVGTLLSTLFLRRNTSAEEFERIKAGEFKKAVEMLLQSGKMTYLEYYKCKNFLSIAEKADKYLNHNFSKTEAGPISNDNYEEPKGHNNFDGRKYDHDFDWFVKFYDYSCLVSDEEMQQIWASILCREIVSARSVSLSLLSTLSIMDASQAKHFCNISRHVLLDRYSGVPNLFLFIQKNRASYENMQIIPSQLKDFARLGLIDCDFASEFVFVDKKEFQTGTKRIVVTGDPTNYNKIKAGNAVFTRDGEALYAIVGKDYKAYDSKILQFILERLRSRNCTITINNKAF